MCVCESLSLIDLVAGVSRLCRQSRFALDRYWSSATHVVVRTLIQSSERQQEIVRGCMSYLSRSVQLQRLNWEMIYPGGVPRVLPRPVFPVLGDVIRRNSATLYSISIVPADSHDIDLLLAISECTSLLIL